MPTIVYWLQEGRPHAESFHDLEFSAALSFSQRKRTEDGTSHISISSEPADSIGKPGVAAVEDGRLPSGESYDWRKRR